MALRVGPMHPVTRRVSRRLVAWGAALLVTLVAAAPARAQVSTFDLSGTVSDDQGGVLPGVTVTVRNEETGISRSAVTDSAGLYYFAALPPQGTWELSAELAGFGTQRRSGLRFSANTKAIVNLALSVGGLAETVTVVAEQQLLDTGSAMVALRVTNEQIRELPLVGRDFLDLALMGAGVSDVASGAPAGAHGADDQRHLFALYRVSARRLRQHARPARRAESRRVDRRHLRVQRADQSVLRRVRPVDVGHRVGDHQERHQPVQRQRFPLRPARAPGTRATG